MEQVKDLWVDKYRPNKLDDYILNSDLREYFANMIKTKSLQNFSLAGCAGMGKTTLALSAPKPLLLDFDNGVKRINMSHLDGVDTVQVTSWSDVQQVMQEDLSAYESIVVDTIGKMMDFIKAGDDANTALEKAKGQYGRVDDAVKIIDPRQE